MALQDKAYCISYAFLHLPNSKSDVTILTNSSVVPLVVVPAFERSGIGWNAWAVASLIWHVSLPSPPSFWSQGWSLTQQWRSLLWDLKTLPTVLAVSAVALNQCNKKMAKRAAPSWRTGPLFGWLWGFCCCCCCIDCRCWLIPVTLDSTWSRCTLVDSCAGHWSGVWGICLDHRIPGCLWLSQSTIHLSTPFVKMWVELSLTELLGG